jgi:hypothetical protein
MEKKEIEKCENRMEEMKENGRMNNENIGEKAEGKGKKH